MIAWVVMVMHGRSDERGKAVEGGDEPCNGLEQEGSVIRGGSANG